MNDIFQQYSKLVIDHFMHPRNIGVIKDADGVGTVGNPRCGDVLKVYLKIGQRPILNKRAKKQKNKETEDYIKDIKVQTLGCGAAIATSSMASEMVKGKSLEKAEKITNKAVAKALGGLPPQKMHCSVLARQGILKAIEDYKKTKP